MEQVDGGHARSVDPAAARHPPGAAYETATTTAPADAILRAMPNDTADLVLTGGRIFTGDAAKSWAEALAVRGNRIVAVGSDWDVRPLTGPQTRTIELKGRTVTAGFQDAHVHPTHGGLARIRCELHEARGKDEYLRIVSEYAAANPTREWILGGGWSLSDFPGGLP